MIATRVSAKGQITLPRRVRNALQLKAGDRVFLQIEADAVILRGLARSTARSLAGSLHQYANKQATNSARAAVRQEVANAAAREG